MSKGILKSVLIGVSMCSRELEIFSVFKQSFALIGLFKNGSGIRVVKFFLRANEKSSQQRARAPLLLMM